VIWLELTHWLDFNKL